MRPLYSRLSMLGCGDAEMPNSCGFASRQHCLESCGSEPDCSALEVFMNVATLSHCNCSFAVPNLRMSKGLCWITTYQGHMQLLC
mmetsp:Transcript_11196/g.33568  ORF Transcript_11196/g.33568 Transcript_11196/m.33568 type:complete len:85 (+) Transcript_11196:409-663(+)